MINRKKQLGQVFTPGWVVNLILDRIGYRGGNVINKYVFEPGCGTGNFLDKIVDEYIKSSLDFGIKKNKIKENLEKYIYGVEIDKNAYTECLNRLNNLTESYNILSVNWNIYNEDILKINKDIFPQFDFVIGNPPYVRVHNIEKSILCDIKRDFSLCKNGIIDLFLVFFEIGIISLNENGKLGFITPNSFIHNSTYVDFRNYLKELKLVKEIVNFKDQIVFKDASTYNAITILDKDHKSEIFDYYEYIDNDLRLVNKIDLNKQDVKKWNLVAVEDEKFLSNIKDADNKISDFATVQYGFATLRDGVFVQKKDIQDNLFNHDFEKEILYPVVKASRYNGGEIQERIIYPYYLEGKTWRPIPESVLSQNFPNTYQYLLSNKNDLQQRSIDKGASWYEYGRSQGVQTVHNKKLVISPVFKDEVKVFKVDKSVMVYSGLYLFVDPESPYSLDYFLDILRSDKFKKYAKMIGKDMRGGYKNINSKAIKEFCLL